MVTRKSTGDVALSNMVKLLIFDEVHLLHDDRGSVIETLVARTLRQVSNHSLQRTQVATVETFDACFISLSNFSQSSILFF